MTACPIEVDQTTSTLTLAGQRFPAVVMVCPPADKQVGECDWCRSLGDRAVKEDVCPAGFVPSTEFYVPTENGLLVELRWHPDPGSLDVHLNARTCRLSERDPDDPLWLPHSVAYLDGALVPYDIVRKGTWDWSRSEPDWALEHIMRMTRLPFAQPPGPAVTLHRLSDELERTCETICGDQP